MSDRGGRRPVGPVLAISVLIILACAFLWPLPACRTIYAASDFSVSDLWNLNYPLRVLLHDSLGRGSFPLWADGIYCGFPVFAEGEGGFAYPLNLVTYGLLPPLVALNLGFVIHLVIGGIGTLLLARQLRMPLGAAFVAALAWMFAGPVTIANLRQVNLFNAVAWLPWVILAIGYAADRPRASRIALGAIVCAVQLLAGSVQLVYVTAWIAALFYLSGCLWGRDRTRLLRAWVLPAVFAGGVVLAAVQLLPTAELLSLSERASGLDPQRQARGSLAPVELIRLLAPYARGDAADNSYSGELVMFWNGFLYMGLLPIALAVVACARRPRDPLVKILLSAAALSVLLAMGRHTPLAAACKWVPGFEHFRFPVRFFYGATLSLALLAGLGATAFLARAGRHRLALLSLLVGAHTVDTLAHTRQQVPVLEASALSEPAWIARLMPAGKRSDVRVLVVAASEAALSVYRRSGGWQGNLDGYADLLRLCPPNLQVVHGLAAANGYLNLVPEYVVQSWGDATHLGRAGELGSLDPQRGALVLRREFVDLASLSAVRYIVSPLPIVNPELRLVADQGPFLVYENPRWLPRVYLLPRAAVSSSGELSCPASELEMDRARGVAWPRTGTSELRREGDVRVVHAAPGEWRLRCTSPEPATLVVGDTDFPGWDARLNGIKTPVARLGGMLRRLEIDSGETMIEMRYAPRSLRAGILVSALGLAVVLVVGIRGWLARRSALG